MRRLISLVLVCGCGSVDGAKVDGAVADGKVIDGPFDGAVPSPCNLSAPFGTPTPVAGVNSNSTDEWGWISADGKTLYFDSVASGGSDYNLYYATRATTTDPFSNVQLLGVGNSTDAENRGVLRGDDKELFFQRTVPQASTKIYHAGRVNVTDSFDTPSPPLNINDASATVVDANPWISADGLTLYMTSTRNGNYDIFKATRSIITADFGAPVAVGELNSTAVDDAPVLSGDGLEIFFASNRPNANRNNIWHATRSSTTDGFGTPSMVAELSSDTTEDYPNWISPDRCTILFTSDRTGGNGGYDVWMAKRPR
jgi:Tol biopolymer transport system component